ncbi:TetR family transcriptional regulator [Gordonia sp. HY442]|uniref:TetR/AcrR family transcriptional regulator n=1 Tax=Gordonia zhenghanii TaxID=2911516 RepID=UPI001F3C8CD8|nr:TetR family transcriptional regulator [Gordonia zhenghanii]MCF8606264.1 TetR family transcriptional regulator [Gordonia zhenghanii]
MADLTARPDRRTRIADAALDLAADGGNRAVTHSGVDRYLDLPKGSTSYYFRTRRGLLDAALTHLTATSAASFVTSRRFDAPHEADAADVVGRYLHTLTTSRTRDVRARFALASDAAHDADFAAALRDSLCSRPGAVALFTALGASDAESDAADLLVFCEGVAATHLFSGVSQTTAELTSAVRRRFELTSQ